MIADLVVAAIRAAASQHVARMRMFTLFGLPQTDPIFRAYSAACAVGYPRGAR